MLRIVERPRLEARKKRLPKQQLSLHFNGTSTTENEFLFGTGANGGVVVTTFGGPVSDAAAFIVGAGHKSSTVSFVQCVAASSAACFNSVGSSFCAFILISSTSAEKWSACPHGFASPEL